MGGVGTNQLKKRCKEGREDLRFLWHFVCSYSSACFKFIRVKSIFRRYGKDEYVKCMCVLKARLGKAARQRLMVVGATISAP